MSKTRSKEKLFDEITHQIVNTTTLFKVDETFNDERFMRVRVAIMHTNLNRNNSFFKKEVIEAAKESFKNIPILAEVKINADKSLDYTTHAMHIEDDAFKEGEQRIIYDEKVVGIVPETNDFEFVMDDETGNEYVYVTALLYRDYGNYCCDILEKRGGKTDVSAEIFCDDVTFNGKGKYLEVGKMIMSGCTLLGNDVEPGMVKANATTFEQHKVSYQEDYIKIMQELKKSLDNYTSKQNEISKEGGTKVNLEQLLIKYSKNIEDITFETEGLSIEELEAKFAEAFEVLNTDNTGSASNEATLKNTENLELDVTKTAIPEGTLNLNADKTISMSFDLTHDEIRYALYQLIKKYNELDNDYYYLVAVYDDRFVMQSWNESKYFGQTYSKDEDNVELTGDRYPLYAEFLTESEKLELEEMRKNIKTYEEKITKYETDELNSEKDKLFSDEAYSQMTETDEFKTLVSEKGEFSVEELTVKLDLALAKFVKQGNFSFAAKKTSTTPKKLNFIESINEKPQKSSYLSGLLGE